MPFVPAPNVAQAELRFTLGTQKAENVLYFEASAGISTTLMGNLAAALDAWWKANLKASASSSVVLTEVYVTDLTTDTSPTLSRLVLAPATGTDVGTVLPNNVAYCVQFKTGHRGRSGRGRNYIMGLTTGTVTGNTLSGPAQTVFLNAYSLLIGAGTFVAGFQWGVLSRIHNGADRAAGLFQPITSVNVFDATVDSQRRRLPGRGR